MSIVAHAHPFVVGVDTHARNHVYAILVATTGALLESRSFPTTAAGINRAIDWVASRTGADADTLSLPMTYVRSRAVPLASRLNCVGRRVCPEFAAISSF